MADTIINTPGNQDSGANAVGWVLALVVVFAVIAVSVLWYRSGAPGLPNSGSKTNINIELPSGSDVIPKADSAQ